MSGIELQTDTQYVNTDTDTDTGVHRKDGVPAQVNCALGLFNPTSLSNDSSFYYCSSHFGVLHYVLVGDDSQDTNTR